MSCIHMDTTTSNACMSREDYERRIEVTDDA